VSAPIRVVIADDHAPTRAGVRLALEGRGFAVCGEAGEARGAIRLAEDESPDLCLLDVHMPGNGLVAAAEIAQRCPDVAIVMLSVSAESADVFNALRVGACGYLLKDTPPSRLPSVLKGVLAGEAALPRALVTRLVHEFRLRGLRERGRHLRHGDAELTIREWEVLELMREGLTTTQIAEEMQISAVTVRTHVQHILRKLKVTTRSEALALLPDDVGR
jgi:DNA-binding NarL/FixJ family response regulator